MRFRRWLAGAVLAGAACIDLSTDPDEVVAIEFLEPAWPSVVAGDTLRDDQGQVAPLQALLFDASGDVVSGIPVTFLARDERVRITEAGLLIGVDTADGPTELLASAPGLQSNVRRLEVVPSPDSISAGPAVDTLRWVLPDVPATNTSPDLSARVLHFGDDDTTGVRAWIVRYRLEFGGQEVPPGDTSLVYLVNASGRPQSADTTDVNGSVALRVRVRPGPGLGALDSAVVTLEAQYRGVPIPGGPIRVVVPLVPAGVAFRAGGAGVRLHEAVSHEGGRRVRPW
ncbi:MAG TPA: hypothetical protein VF178_01420 [Gemmatimonadaceae bacterium]